MTSEAVDLEEAPFVNFVGFTVSVFPDRENPGRNVRLLIELLQKVGVIERVLEVDDRPGWEGVDAEVYMEGDTRGVRVIPVRIVDWAPEEGEPWGGPSDNMLEVMAAEDTPEYVADWIIAFLKEHGHAATSERVSDGTIDVFSPTLFVSMKINIR